MRLASKRALISSYFYLCSAGSSSYVIGSSLVIPSAEVDVVDEDGPIGRAECVVGKNPPASSNRQHEEPGGSRDCWWVPVPRSTAQNPAHDLSSGLLGVPPDLVPDQEGEEVTCVSFLHAQTHVNISPSYDWLIR
jgi:hypothetical protein